MAGSISNVGLIKAFAKSMAKLPLTDKETFYVDMYASEIAAMLSRGRLVPLSDLSYDEVQISYNYIGSLNTKHKVYCVSKFATEFNANITDELKQKIIAVYPEVKLITQKTSVPFFYKTNTRQFVAAHANSIRNHESASKFFNKLSPDVQERGYRMGSKIVNSNFIKTMETDRMSYEYVKSMVTHNRLSLTYFMLHVIMPETIERADDYQDEDPEETIANFIHDFAVEKNCIIKEVRDLREYISSLSPIGYLTPKALFSNINANLFAPPNFSAHMDYTQGVEGKSGVDYGIVLDTNTPLCLDTKSSSFAQVFLITGKTGFGKTNIMKSALEQHLLLGDYLDVCDFKGKDYSGLLRLYPQLMKRVDMDEGSYPNLFDLSNFPNPTDSTLDSVIGYIVNSLIIMMELQGNEVDKYIKQIDDLLTTLTKNYFVSKGVYDEVHSHKNSIVCNYFDFWGYASNIMNTSPSIREDYKDVIPLALKRLSMYFTPHGARSNYLKRQLNLSEFIDAQGVIYAFNVLEKIDSADVKTQLSYLFMNAISNIRNNKIVSEHKMQVVTIEEFQVASNALGMLRTVAKQASVSRSANVTLYILLNDIGIFQTESKGGKLLVTEAESKALNTIKACFTSYFIGFMNKENVQQVRELFDIKEILPNIETINSNTSNDESKFNFAFKYDTGNSTGYGTMRSMLPDKYKVDYYYGTRKIVDELK